MTYLRSYDLIYQMRELELEKCSLEREIEFKKLEKKWREDLKRGVENDLRNIARATNIPIRDEPFIMPKYHTGIPPIKDEPFIMPKYLPDIII